MRISSSVDEKQILTPSHWGRFWTDTQRPINSSNQSLKENRSKIILTLRKLNIYPSLFQVVAGIHQSLNSFCKNRDQHGHVFINLLLTVYPQIWLLVLAFLLYFSSDSFLNLFHTTVSPGLIYLSSTIPTDKNKWHFISLYLEICPFWSQVSLAPSLNSPEAKDANPPHQSLT